MHDVDESELLTAILQQVDAAMPEEGWPDEVTTVISRPLWDCWRASSFNACYDTSTVLGSVTLVLELDEWISWSYRTPAAGDPIDKMSRGL